MERRLPTRGIGGDPVSDCEHAERIERALFAMEQMKGSGVIDLPKLRAILRGKS